MENNSPAVEAVARETRCIITGRNHGTRPGDAMIPFRSKLTRYLESLRFPWLLLVTALLFVADLFVPDAIPFVDEALLALVAILLGRLKRKPRPDGEPQAGEPPA